MPSSEVQNQIDKEKSIMGYKVKFKTFFDEADANGDFITLKIEVSDELCLLLKKATINATVPGSHCISSRDSEQKILITRYKIKNVINQSIDSSIGVVVFAKDLIDDKKIEINYKDIDRVLQMIEYVKNAIRKTLEILLSVANLTQEVIYK